MEGKEKKIITLSIGIVLAIVLVAGVTSSFFVRNKKQEKGNVIATSCFDITLEDENLINLASAYPISDEDGMKGEPYTFTITNICDNKTHYDISLEALSDTTFQSSSIMVGTDTNYKLYSDYDDSSMYFEGSKDARVLTSGTLDKGDSKTFNLRLWINKDAPITEQNKVFKSKIIVYANLDN